jgi:hypothetical protein
MYSASAVDVATTDCFFDCQYIESLSINKINLDVDFLSYGSQAKSESLYATSPCPLYVILKFLVKLSYFKMFIIIFQSEKVGCSVHLEALLTAKEMSGLVHLAK